MESKRGRRHEPSRRGQVCSRSVGPLDPLLLDNDAWRDAARAADPKSLSLCAQAQRALDYALAGECADEWLNDLVVIDVVPDPTTRRLRVWLGVPYALDDDTRRALTERLLAATGYLRSCIAQAIHRKRTPHLAFELVAGGDAAKGEAS